ncbi:hypothetical protein [Burkholderia ubonensis]|nr:hypothetical protein [Burkholderia ubonensis]
MKIKDTPSCMTLNLSSSRIVILIRSVAAIEAPGAGPPAAG